MATLQIRVDDILKNNADSLFSSLGMDTSTAIRIFLRAAVENEGIPFPIQHKTIPASLQQAVYDSRNHKNLNGPYNSAEEAITSMLGE